MVQLQFSELPVLKQKDTQLQKRLREVAKPTLMINFH